MYITGHDPDSVSLPGLIMPRCVTQHRHTVVWYVVCAWVTIDNPNVRLDYLWCYRHSSSPGGIQVKLNAFMYLKPHSLGFKFAGILR